MTLHATRNAQHGTVTVHTVYGPVSCQVTENEQHAALFAQGLLRLLPDFTEVRAEAGYAKYVAHCGGVSVHGDELPGWEHLPEKIREHWVAAFTE